MCVIKLMCEVNPSHHISDLPPLYALRIRTSARIGDRGAIIKGLKDCLELLGVKSAKGAMS